ncbi:hypothetical protein Pan216_30400 [Planctomycetes bacterium Pan216]|uniref:Minor tail T domain-containing protein n=1 Tax=Kolteria novifilia TaxID=2527975 RepID=A0A518B5B9_9BACT|nr:hypothetical protein Pan216_30400 [Planctomycetes bacterium Pan216]
MTRRQLLRSLDSAELTEWTAYWNLEPWGEEKADYRTGLLASVMCNLWKSKKGKTYKPEDFMPKTKRRRNWMTNPKQIWAYLCSALGKPDKKD